MKKVIIGIHGLKNKAPRKLLSDWWQDSIHEGLNRHCTDKDFHFELVYWADLNYEKPLDPNINDKDDPLYIINPYVPGIGVDEIPEMPSTFSGSLEVRVQVRGTSKKGKKPTSLDVMATLRGANLNKNKGAKILL